MPVGVLKLEYLKYLSDHFKHAAHDPHDPGTLTSKVQAACK